MRAERENRLDAFRLAKSGERSISNHLGERKVLAVKDRRPEPGVQSSQRVQADQQELLVDRAQPVELFQPEFRILSIFERQPNDVLTEVTPGGEVDNEVHQGKNS